MSQFDVAQVGVTFGVSGVEAARAALESVEATGQRVGAAIGKITTTVSVQGADAGAQLIGRMTDATNALTRSSGTATQAVQADSAARASALAREAAAAEKAAAQAEAAVARRQAAVTAANVAEQAAIRSAGGDPSGVAAAITRASDRAAQALDAAQAKATQLQEAAARARQEADAAARSVERATATAPAAAASGPPRGRIADPMAGAVAITLASIPADQSGRLERLAAAATAAGQAVQTLGAEAIPARVAVAEQAVAAEQAAAATSKATITTETFLAALKAMGVAATASGNAVSVAGADMATATGMASKLGASVTVLERGTVGAASAASGMAAALGTEAAAARDAAAATDAAAAATRRFTVAAPSMPRTQGPEQRFTVAAPTMPTRAIQQAGDAAVVSGSKFRSAANGLTALAFAATGSGHSFQGMALGAGLAVSSLAELGGSAGAAAGQIGAIVTIAAAVIGIIERLTDRTKEYAALGKSITNREFIRGTDDANTALAQLDAGIANVQANLAKMRAETLQPLTGGYGWLGALRGPIRAAEQDLEEAYKRRKELTDLRDKSLVQESADARRTATVEGARAELQAATQGADERLAAEHTRYETGLSDLASYHAQRLATIRADAGREVATLRAQQAALRDDTGRPTDESKAARATRLAEAQRLGTEIRAIESKGAAEVAAANADRAAQEIALSQRIQAAHADVFNALGLQHETEMAQIREKARLYGITLAQQNTLSADAQKRTVDDYRETLTQQATAATAQREIGRLQIELGAERTRIHARVADATLTEVEGAKEIAAAERAALPDLTAQLDVIERMATALGNKDLLATVRQLRAELSGMGREVTTLQGRVDDVFNSLARQATTTAGAIRAKIDEMLAKTGGIVTPKIAFTAEALSRVGSQVDESFKNFGESAAGAFGNALSAGIAALGDGPITFKTFFENMGNSILSGLGSIFVQMGSELLVYGAIMLGLLPFLVNPFTSGGAAIAAGLALITTGSVLGAIATKNAHHGGGGGGGGYQFTPPNQDQSASVILTPRAAGKAPQAMQQSVFAPTIIGVNDPAAQRAVKAMYDRASKRGINDKG